MWRLTWAAGAWRWYFDEGRRSRRYYATPPPSSRVVAEQRPPATTRALSVVIGAASSTPIGGTLLEHDCKILGVWPSVDAATLRRAYRRRVLPLHPDQGGPGGALYRETVEAYARMQRHVAGEPIF